MRNCARCCMNWVMPVIAAILPLAGGAYAAQVVQSTGSDFSPGAFYQTVLQGTESAPQIRLDSYSSFNWTFEDDDITGWTFTPGTGVSEENPSGQIHVRAQYVSAEAYAYAARPGLTIPNQFVAEIRIKFDALQPSGVVNPLVNQPTGGCSRFDVQNGTAGIRVDIFSDRIVSFYRLGTTGANYPTLAYCDVSFNTGQWYVLRFEADFSAPNMPVQVYRDNVWIGQLKADARNSASATYRLMAYSRASGSGLTEQHIDYAKLGSIVSSYYSSGSYTSTVMDLQASSFGALSWAGPASVYPWGQWEKYAGNPVVTGSALVENMLCEVSDPLQQPVLYNGKYWMCWSNGSTIDLSYSTDPNLMVWTNYSGNPVLSPTAGTETYVYSPNIFRDGATYYLFYDVYVNSAGTQLVGYATASAPTGPWTKGQYILNTGSSGEWDDLRVSEPFVFKEGDTYYLYYMGDHGCSGCKEQVGLATTTSSLFPLGAEAGGLWTKHGLVLPNGSGPTDWDRGLTADPSIIKVGSTYFMRYTGSYTNASWQLGAAWADNPYGPWHHPAAPEITLGPAGAWDSNKLVRGAIHYHNGKYYSPYTGSLSGYQGGMASAEPYGAENTIVFETRTSSDGANWEAWKAVLNGAAITSTPQKYFQYRATFALQTGGVSPVLSSVTTNYTVTLGLVSLLPATQSAFVGSTDTLWIHLDDRLIDIKGATFKIGIDGNYLEPLTVIAGPALPASHVVYGTYFPDSILIDVGILEGHFDGPGDVVGIVVRPKAAIAASALVFARSDLRDLANQSIAHSTVGAQMEILADIVRPTCSVDSPPSDGIYNILPAVNIRFQDNNGLNRGYYQIDGCTGSWQELWSYNSNRSDTSVVWSVPGVSQGSHVIHFKVSDDAGLVNADTCSYAWSFAYDNIPPEVPVLLTPANSIIINDNTPDFTWTATAGGGVYSVQLSTDPTFVSNVTTVSGLAVAHYTPAAPLVDGVWHWRVKARDLAGNESEYSGAWSLTIDVVPPSAPTSFVVAPGHEKCKLSWTNPGGDFAGVMIRRNPWAVGAYPEYDDSHPSPLGYPALPTDGELAYQGTASAFLDSNSTALMPRNIYYYSIFAFDAAGNYSAAGSDQQGRATNYWLGDVSGDGVVYQQDLMILSNTFRASSGDPNYVAAFDIGPTVTGSPRGIPTTDNVVDFEDLAIFAINFDAVGPNMKVVPVLEGHDVSGNLALGLDVPVPSVAIGDEFVVRVMLQNNPGTVKAVHFSVKYDPTQLEFVSVDRSAALKEAPQLIFYDGRHLDQTVDVSLALLGGANTIGGSGELATISFRLLRPGSKLTLDVVDIRDVDNTRLVVENANAAVTVMSELPRSYGLSQNYPNPFNPETVISYQLPNDGFVSVAIYNIQGQLVKNLVSCHQSAGTYTVKWDGTNSNGYDCSSGVYFYRMISGDYREARKMLLMK